MSRPAALLLVLALSSCAPAGSTDRTVQVHGVLEQTAALSGLEGWILTTDAGPILAVDFANDASGDPSGHSCVVIQVDDDFPHTDDEGEIADALQAVSEESGESLLVVDFCD